ncbi:hypothetical protein GCM10028805_29450 [Spirosoma harenae]
MRNLLLLLLWGITVMANAQNLPNNNDIHTWKAPYQLIIPDGWTTERFCIPIDFAPQIPYKGVEELRFAPGWGKRTSADYWSYAYVWWLEGTPKIDAAILQENLKFYYSGLVERNRTTRNNVPGKAIPTEVIIKQEKPTPEGTESYSGSIKMLDYISQFPITLNCLIYINKCKQQKHTAIIVEISPKKNDHIIWQKLHSIQRNFICSK